MSVEYKDRGLLHKAVNSKLNPVQKRSRKFVIKAMVKSALAVETTALFSKDAITNRLVGKEFHIRFERNKRKSGKFKTDIKIVRANAPIYKPQGVLHKVVDLGRFVEGDKPAPLHKAHQKLKTAKAKTLPGKLVLGATKLTVEATHQALKVTGKTALATETVTIRVGKYAVRKLTRNLQNSSETSDAGKAFLYSYNVIRGLNSGRKVLIRHKAQKANYKQEKAIFDGKKLQIKSQKQQLKASKKESSRAVIEVKKKSFKNQQKLYKIAQKNLKKRKPPSLTVTALGAGTKRLTASAWQKMLASDSSNDVAQGIDKSVRVTATTVKATKAVKTKLQQKTKSVHNNKLQKQSNKLKEKEDYLKKNKKKVTKKKQHKHESAKKNTQRAKESAKKMAQAVWKTTQYAFAKLGILLIPIIAILLSLVVFLSAFSGTIKNGHFVLATYNAQDRYLSKATEIYTQFAYAFNQQIIRCGNSSTWKDALAQFGVNTSSYKTTPKDYKFGKSVKFNYTPKAFSESFDIDKLASFMCAYAYDFNNTGNWEWKDEYEQVVQALFLLQYEFKHVYEDKSGWEELQNYTFYGGGGADKSYWTVYSDITKSTMRIQNVPPVISAFCKDGKLHYDYNTLEVLNANNGDKRTGYFIQDQRYIVSDMWGQSNYPFYKYDTSNNKYGFYHGKDNNGNDIWNERSSWYWTDNKEIYYLVNPTDTKTWNNNLNDTCLINFYQKNYWHENCTLYYTVQQTRSFDEATQMILSQKDKFANGRLQIYSILSQPDDSGNQAYGCHQMLKSPVSKSLQELIDNKMIFNGYGYDVQTWNSTHCNDLTSCHNGIDIQASSSEKVYAMFDGIVVSVNPQNYTMILISNPQMKFWYDSNKSYSVMATYTNVSASISSGTSVKAGDVIGKVNTFKHCENISNQSATKNYLHISLQIYYRREKQNDWIWVYVDPRYLIQR